MDGYRKVMVNYLVTSDLREKGVSSPSQWKLIFLTAKMNRSARKIPENQWFSYTFR
jgi:hypothetical protein